MITPEIKGRTKEKKMRPPTRDNIWAWGAAFVLILLVQIVPTPTKATLTRYDGEVNIGLLVNLHHPPANEVEGHLPQKCGAINVAAVQKVIAAKWAVDVINNQSLPHEVKIGLQVHDTCRAETLTQNHLFSVISAARRFRDSSSTLSGPSTAGSGGTRSSTSAFTSKNKFFGGGVNRIFAPTKPTPKPKSVQIREPPLIGMVGIGDDPHMLHVTDALRAFDIPIISATPQVSAAYGHPKPSKKSGASSSSYAPLTTAPDLSGQARALATLAAELNLSPGGISLISSSHKIIEVFLSEASALGVRVPRILELGSTNGGDVARQVEQFLEHHPNNGEANLLTSSTSSEDATPTVVMIVSAAEARAVAEELKHSSSYLRRKRRRDGRPPFLWLIGSLGLDLVRPSSWRRVYEGAIFVEPHLPEMKEFTGFFIDSLSKKDLNHPMQDVLDEYKEEVFGCSSSRMENAFLMPCNGIPKREIELRTPADLQVSFVIKAVSALTAAFRLVQLERCERDVRNSCLREIHPGLNEDILNNLRKLSFSSSMMPEKDEGPEGQDENEIEGTQRHFTRAGKLVSNKQIIYFVPEGDGTQEIGWYTEDEGLFYDRSALASSYPSSFAAETSAAAASTTSSSNADTSSSRSRSKAMLETVPIYSQSSFLSRTWAIVVLTAAALGAAVTVWMFFYVLQKIADGTLQGSQIMGILLLCGVMGLFASVIPWVLPPNETVCGLRHTLHPLLMALCFAVLLVKSMQLRSLVTLGLGGTLPQVNQLISLFFMVAVQAVVEAEWYFSSRPVGMVINDGYPECGVSRPRFLLLHIYPAVLLVLSFFYGVSVLKIKRNFNEGRWITVAAIFIIPVFAAWPAVYYFAPAPFHDPSVAVSVLAVGGVLIAAIFVPKMHTITQQSSSIYNKTSTASGSASHRPRTKSVSEDIMSRSHSDATVYTGFSDYMQHLGVGSRYHHAPRMYHQHPPPMAAPPAQAPSGPPPPPIYPVYGYTTNQFVSPYPRKTSKVSSPSKKKKNSTNSGAYYQNSPRKISQSSNFVAPNKFNGLNFVPPVHNLVQPQRSRSPRRKQSQLQQNLIEPQQQRVKSFSEWTREFNSSSYKPISGYGESFANPPSPPTLSEDEGSIYSVPRYHQDKIRIISSTTDSSSLEEEQIVVSAKPNNNMNNSKSSSGNNKKRKDSKSSNGSPKALQNGTSRFVDLSHPIHPTIVHRQNHSRSPSDGMILTASGLTTDIIHPGFSGGNSRETRGGGGDGGGGGVIGSGSYKVSEVYLTH